MKIIITGAAGIIGTVLMRGLKNKYDVVGIDKKVVDGVVECDISDEEKRVHNLFEGADVVVHLAWDIKEGGVKLFPVLEENKRMAEFVLASALEKKIKRVILASSVQVSFGHLDYQYPNIVKEHNVLHDRKISLSDQPYPLGVYGASKVYIEMLGKVYASHGLEVVAVRFGNVTSDNSTGEYPFWLSHSDCSQFIERCCVSEALPTYSVFFAVSNNACNPFDCTPAQALLGYQPQDGSRCPFELS